MRQTIPLLVCCLLASSCGNSARDSSGAGEPLVVHNGQFFQGAFPADSGGPEVAAVKSSNSTIRAGEIDKNLFGFATPTSQAIALAFQGLGHGYWIVPVGGEDTETSNFKWAADTDFSRNLPGGPQALIYAASSTTGAFGPISDQNVQVVPFLPSGHVVASLTWGNESDLDLHVVAPSGKEIDPKHINTTGVVDGGADAGDPLPDDGQLDRDSNPDCVIDGLRIENVVWLNQIPPGTYLFRVDMFSACGLPSTNFEFTLYVDGLPVFQQGGRLLDINADGGGPGSGLFIGSYTF